MVCRVKSTRCVSILTSISSRARAARESPVISVAGCSAENKTKSEQTDLSLSLEAPIWRGVKGRKKKKEKTSFKTGNLTPLPLSMRKHREEVHCPPGRSASVRGFLFFFPPPAKEEDGSSLSRTLAQRRWEECILIPERWPWGAQHCYAPQHPHSHAHTLTHQDFCFFFLFFLTCVTGSCRLASSFLPRGNEQCTIRSFISSFMGHFNIRFFSCNRNGLLLFNTQYVAITSFD